MALQVLFSAFTAPWRLSSPGDDMSCCSCSGVADADRAAALWSGEPTVGDE